MSFLVNHSSLCKNMRHFDLGYKHMHSEWKALASEFINKTAMLKRIEIRHADMSAKETSDILRAIINSDSLNTLEVLILSHGANFTESCELMCTLIDKAERL